MVADSGQPVLVGIDGSDSALRAVEWGAREAHELGVPLRLVHALDWPDGMLDPNAVLARRIANSPAGSRHREVLLQTAGERLTAAEATALGAFPDLQISCAFIEGPPAAVLRTQAEHAALAVVGSRGLGGFAGLLAGSVAVGLATAAPCPVVVVRGDLTHPADSPVLVGFDDTEGSTQVLEFAFGAAVRRRVPLEVLFAWRDRYEVPGDGDGVQEVAHRQLTGRLTDLQRHHGAVEVRPLVVSGRPAPALVKQSADAQLVVVGSRGRGGVSSLVLGSVSHTMLHHAHCPVAVIGPLAQRREG